MVYIEPTPYIAGLIGALRPLWDGSIEVHYITTNLTQPWQLPLDSEFESVLPTRFIAKLRAISAALTHDRKRTILHLAGWGHPVLLGSLLMARLLGIPVAVESDTPKGRPIHYSRHLLKKLFYPLLLKLPNHFLPGGTRQARYLEQSGVKRRRITIAQMTVDVCAIRQFCARHREALRSVARERWGMPADARIVLYMGRLEVYKGVEMLLSAFARAADQDNPLRLLMAGDGSLRPCVEAIAARADSRLTYVGRLSGDDVLRAYLAADLLVLPSLFEPWGLVVNEAMACGLPVIVSDQVGCGDDLVRSGETGLVIRANRETELTAAILQLMRDAPARRRMGQVAENLISTWTLAAEARNVISAWDAIAP
jgi:glycosyltransferase involved in cell wall biosynthesis